MPEIAESRNVFRCEKLSRRLGVHLSFRDEDLCALCNRRASLEVKFGEHAELVGRRLWVLAAANRLKDVTTRPPDRRRFEQKIGPRMFSIWVSGAIRIYFEALSKETDLAALESVDAVMITSIGGKSQ